MGLASDLSDFVVGINIILDVMELNLAANLHIESAHQQVVDEVGRVVELNGLAIMENHSLVA